MDYIILIFFLFDVPKQITCTTIKGFNDARCIYFKNDAVDFHYMLLKEIAFNFKNHYIV